VAVCCEKKQSANYWQQKYCFHGKPILWEVTSFANKQVLVFQISNKIFGGYFMGFIFAQQ